jgi:hypothetical protein
MPRFRHRALSSNFLSFGRYNLLSILSFDLLSLNQLDLHRTSIGVRNKTNTRIVKNFDPDEIRKLLAQPANGKRDTSYERAGSDLRFLFTRGRIRMPSRLSAGARRGSRTTTTIVLMIKG